MCTIIICFTNPEVEAHGGCHLAMVPDQQIARPGLSGLALEFGFLTTIYFVFHNLPWIIVDKVHVLFPL